MLGDIRACAGLREQAEQMLARGAAPSVECMLLSGVLSAGHRDRRLAAARRRVSSSDYAEVLGREQKTDGGWGRFHSSDSRCAGAVPTTEYGVERAVAIGLGPRHGVRIAASHYVSEILRGRVTFPDPAERNERWETGSRLFAGATLARLEPRAAAVTPVWRTWVRLAERAFETGRYSARGEATAHADLTGVKGELRYLALHGKYQLALLGSRAADLNPELSRALVHWIWSRAEGVGYLGWPLSRLPDSAAPLGVEAWFLSLELVSRLPGWRSVARAPVQWLWDARRSDGMWDLGSRWPGSAVFPLSSSWREREARSADWSARVMSLLATYHGCH